MGEQIRSDQPDLTAAQQAREAASAFLDEAGMIDFTRFNAETLAALESGPGRVEHPVEQAPIHTYPTIELEDGQVLSPAFQFASRWNNFDKRFVDNHFYGEICRQQAYYQRFRILFPELESVARRVGTAYLDRRREAAMRQDYMYREEETEEFMRFLYGVMSQLVDENDEERPGVLVKDSPTHDGMLTY